MLQLLHASTPSSALTELVDPLVLVHGGVGPVTTPLHLSLEVTTKSYGVYVTQHSESQERVSLPGFDLPLGQAFNLGC